MHDGFRGVAGVFDSTLAAWRVARSEGLRVQVDTTVTMGTVDELPPILRLVHEMGALTWSVFFLVPTGRGRLLPQMSSREIEDVLHFLYDADKLVSAKATEAYHFRGVVLQRRILEERGLDPVEVLGLGRTYLRLRAAARELLPEATSTRDGVRRPPLDVSASRGFVFVSHVGDVFPSGFLPLRAGSVRERSLGEIYRLSPLFEALRDPERLLGRCGRCESRVVCGGSRSRAFGATGDVLAEEPGCADDQAASLSPRTLSG